MNNLNVRKFALVIAVGSIAVASARGEGIKMSGFVDAQYGWTNQTSASQGFSLNDAALYMVSNVAGGSAMIDLPFSSKDVATNNLVLGETKAQAFVSFKYDNGVWWKLGQWDTHLGREAKDANGQRFTRISIFNVDARIPNTHLGLWSGWDGDDVGLSVLVTNPANAGAFGGANPQLGGRFYFGSDDFLKFTINTLYHKRPVGTDMYYSAWLTSNMDPLTLQLEGGFFKPNIRVAEVGERGYGAGLELNYNLDDYYEGLDFGARGEYIIQIVREREAEIVAGPRYAMTKNMHIKLDYAYEIFKATDQLTRTINHHVAAAATYTF